MEINHINNENNQQQNDLKAMIIELSNKYELLENKQKKNEQIILKNKDLILNLNINLVILKQSLDEFKIYCEKSINDLKEKIDGKYIEKKDNNGNEIIGQINNFANKNSEMNKMFEQRKEDLEKEIDKINVNIIENYIDNNNKKENNIKNDNNNNNNIELKINKDEEITVFQKFENLLAMIIDKNDIDNKNKEELKQVSEKLMINSVIPQEYAAKYFSDVKKYLLKDEENKEKEKKIVILSKEVHSVLEEIINTKN